MHNLLTVILQMNIIQTGTVAAANQIIEFQDLVQIIAFSVHILSVDRRLF